MCSTERELPIDLSQGRGSSWDTVGVVLEPARLVSPRRGAQDRRRDEHLADPGQERDGARVVERISW